MRINGFRCDACCKEHLLDPTLIVQSYRETIPDRWFLVSHGKLEHGQEPSTFCSANCLKDWALKQTITEYEKVN